MKSKHSSSKKAFTPYENSSNCFSTPDNRVSGDTASDLLMAVDPLSANNTPWFQPPAKTSSSSIAPSALSQLFSLSQPPVQAAGNNMTMP